MAKEYIANLISITFLNFKSLVRKINPFYEEKIVILDESGVICNHLLNEANYYFIGPISQVKYLKKPIGIVLRNEVYIITLESLIEEA